MSITLTFEQFQAATRADHAFAERYWPYAIPFMQQFWILESARRTAAFLATISVESDRLEHVEEDLYYKDPLRVATLFKRRFDSNHDGKISEEEVESAKPYCRNPDGLREILYGNFPGRGLIQLTNESNYQAYSDAIGKPEIMLNPKLVREPEDAFRSACWFWYANKCNEAIDNGDMADVTRIVNGKMMLALAERTSIFEHNLTIIQD